MVRLCLSEAYGKHVGERQYVERIVEVDKVVYVSIVPELQARSYRIYRKSVEFILNRPRLRMLARSAIRLAEQCRTAIRRLSVSTG